MIRADRSTPPPAGEELMILIDRGMLFLFAGHDIGPQRFDVGGLQHVAPRRHVVLSLDHRICKARELPGRKGAQVEAASRVVHLPPMTRHAIGRVERGAVADLLGSEWLRLGARAGEHEAEAADVAKLHRCRGRFGYCGINANVHTEPPVGTLSTAIRRATLPPSPDAMLTYCWPLWV